MNAFVTNFFFTNFLFSYCPPLEGHLLGGANVLAGGLASSVSWSLGRCVIIASASGAQALWAAKAWARVSNKAS